MPDSGMANPLFPCQLFVTAFFLKNGKYALKSIYEFSEMTVEKKIVVQIRVNGCEKPVHVVDSVFSSTIKPDLVFLDVSSLEYPNRIVDLPKELIECARKNPLVKFMWDGNNPLADDDEYKLVDFDCWKINGNSIVERKVSSNQSRMLDMTMVSVFYDAGIN